jgi:hypothetical protein
MDGPIRVPSRRKTGKLTVVMAGGASETLESDITERNHRLSTELPDTPMRVSMDSSDGWRACSCGPTRHRAVFSTSWSASTRGSRWSVEPGHPPSTPCRGCAMGGAVDVALSRLRNDAQIRLRCFPPSRELSLGFVVRNRRQDDHVLSALPVHRCRYLVLGG